MCVCVYVCMLYVRQRVGCGRDYVRQRVWYGCGGGIRGSKHIHMDTYVHTHIHIYTYTYTHTHTHKMYVCMYVCIFTCLHMYI